MTEPAAECVAARRTLLDALDALAAHHQSLVLIGAQAVYLHTGSRGMIVAPMTTDADLALDTDLLADGPEIAATMHEAGFKSGQPGHWENSRGVAVDLMVAPHQSNRASTNARAAHLDPHARSVARIGPGLALALSDNAWQIITALDSSDTRQREIRVAGPAALLVVFRLLQACPTAQFTAVLLSQDRSTAAHADIVRGLQVLRDRATETNHDLPVLATRASGDDPTVAASLVVLARELLAAMS